MSGVARRLVTLTTQLGGQASLILSTRGGGARRVTNSPLENSPKTTFSKVTMALSAYSTVERNTKVFNYGYYNEYQKLSFSFRYTS